MVLCDKPELSIGQLFLILLRGEVKEEKYIFYIALDENCATVQKKDANNDALFKRRKIFGLL